MKIILGRQYIENDRFSQLLVDNFKQQDIKSEVILKYNRKGILNFLEQNLDCNTIILQEYMEPVFPITVDFINMLGEQYPDLKVILILSSDRKNDKEILQRFYLNKIYNILFEEDASIEQITRLILNSRQPMAAKSYLGIDDDARSLEDKQNDIAIVSDEQLKSIINALYNVSDQDKLFETYEYITSQYNDAENIYIISKLPNEIDQYLKTNLTYIKHKTTLGQLGIIQQPISSKTSNKKEIVIKEVIKEKVKVKVEYRDVVESVFKKIITVYSPTGEGTSTIAAHLAHAISINKECKVALLDFQIFSPVQREIFGVNHDYTLKDALDAVIKNTLSPVVLESYTKQSRQSKNLDILAGLYDFNEYYNTQESHFEEIIEKAKFNYDYVVIDTHSLYDLYSTNRALLMADEILVPVRGRKDSIDTVNRYLDNFAEYIDFDIRKFKLVINKYSGDDLTSIEISAKTEYPIAGYISYHKDYDSSNAFKNSRLMGEYIDILNEIGIKTSKRKRFLEQFNVFKGKKDDK